MGSLDGRVRRLADRLPRAEPHNPFAGPVPPEDLAFLDALEDVTRDTTPEERRVAWPEVLRLAGEKAIRPLGWTAEEIDEYVAGYLFEDE